MANRLLLTLLALLTGLIAPAGSAQARIGAAPDAQVNAVIEVVAVRVSRAVASPALPLRPGPVPFGGIRNERGAHYRVLPVATVLPGVDRAHE